MEETNPDVALHIVQVLIPLVMPIVTALLRKWLAGLDGSGALWANMALNVAAQLAAALSGVGAVPQALALGVGGGLMGSGGFSAVNSVKKKVSPTHE